MTIAPRFSLSLVAVALAAASVVLLSGCTAITDVLHRESSTHFDSAAQLRDEWNKQAAWVPGNATDIDVHESTAGAPAILAARGSGTLDPSECVKVERRSLPVFVQDWSPNAVVASAYACGAWDVIATDHGWYGWTPNDPDEEAASPAS